MIFRERGGASEASRTGASGIGIQLAAVVLAVNLFLGALATFVLWESRARHEDKVRAQARTIGDLVAQDIHNDFEKVDIALQELIAELASYRARGAPAVDDWLNGLRSRHGGIDILRVADADGRIAHTSGDPAELGQSVADRSYFKRLRDDASAGLVVSEPVRGRFTGRMVLVLARRLAGADGTFAGVAIGSVSTALLAAKFDALRLGPNDVLALRDRNLRITARRPKPAEDHVSDVVPDSDLAAIARNPDTGESAGPCPIDGVNRLRVYRRDARFGHYLFVGLAIDDYLAAWRTEVMRAVALLALVLAFSSFLAIQLGRAWRGHATALSRLRDQDQLLVEAQRLGRFGHCRYAVATDRWDASPALLELFGVSAEDPKTLASFLEIVHPDDRERFATAFRGALIEQRQALTIDFRIVRPVDGELRWLAAFGLPASAATDGVAVGIVHDVSDFKRAEHAMRDALAMLQSFLDQFPGLAYLKDADSRILMANRQTEAFFGAEHAGIIGRRTRELFPGAFGEKLEADDRRIVDSGETEVIEESYRGRYYETRKFCLDGPQGRRLGGVTVDITARVRSAQRFRGLLELHESGDSLDEAATLRRAVHLATQLTGSPAGFLYLVDDAGGAELAARVPGDDAVAGGIPPVDAAAGARRAGFEAVAASLAPVVFSSQSPSPAGCLAAVPVLEATRLHLVIGVFAKAEGYDEFDVGTLRLLGHDVWQIVGRDRARAALQGELDEKTRLAARLEQTQSQLLQSEKMASIGQLAAGIAHELNNPIGFIQSNFGTLDTYVADLLQALDLAERCAASSATPCYDELRRFEADKDIDFVRQDIRQLLAESRDGADRVRRIVQNLKDFSHVSEDEWVWSDLRRGLESTLTIVWNEIKYKAEIEKQYGELPEVYCMPAQLNQVFMNLLVNAAQAIESKGKIVLRAGASGDGVWIEIEDNGKGIAPEHLNRVFDPFFTTKPVGQGTGLGLSLAWSIVEKHHGRISVDSTVAVGTTFRIELPLNGKTGSVGHNAEEEAQA